MGEGVGDYVWSEGEIADGRALNDWLEAINAQLRSDLPDEEKDQLFGMALRMIGEWAETQSEGPRTKMRESQRLVMEAMRQPEAEAVLAEAEGLWPGDTDRQVRYLLRRIRVEAAKGAEWAERVQTYIEEQGKILAMEEEFGA